MSGEIEETVVHLTRKKAYKYEVSAVSGKEKL